MQRLTYRVTSGCIFAVIAILQAVRAIGGVHVQVGDTAVPIALSWVVVVVAGGLSVWAFRSRT